ncbi:MAG: putative LPS assembly protein LptD [Bacteroidota bacterium]
MPIRRLATIAVALLAGASAAQEGSADSTATRPDSTAILLEPMPAGVDEIAGDPSGSVDTLDTSPQEPIRLSIPQAPPAEGGLERPVRYTARDSLIVLLAPRDSAATDEGDVVRLFGDVQTEYEGSTIRAGRVEYRASDEVLIATPADSAGTESPTFDGEEGTFTGDTFTYNLRSQRGRVTGARTEIQDGYLLGGILKQRDERVVFAQDAAYTTCELNHPHYALEAGRIKVVDGERVFTGPVRLRLLGIALPVVLPFGYFPAAEGRRSGPLAVTYGQESGYGLFLGNVGWYFALSDYLDAQIAGKVGTEGSFQLSGVANYNRRYAYSGQVSLDYGRLRSGESTDPTFSLSTPVGLRWNHNQTFPAGQRLTASVNLQSASQRLVSTDVSEQIRSSTSSSVSYTQQWPTAGRSLTVSLQAFQDFANDRTTATLPNLSFSQRRVFPFRRGRDERWYEKISVEYSANAENRFSYAPRDSSVGVSALDALFSETSFRSGVCDPDDVACDETRFDYTVTQRVPVTATFSVPRFNLAFGPNLTYTETWTGEQEERTFNADSARVESRTVPGFTAVRQLQLSASASTEFYGTFPVRVGSLDGIRHTVSPRVSLNFEPDYADFGFVREVQADTVGTIQRYPIVPRIPTTTTRSLSFSVNNAFVARTVRTDSTGAEDRQTRQVLSFDIASSYNFANNRTPFAPVRTTLTTSLLGVSARGNASFSVYAPDTVAAQAPPLYLDVAGRPLRLQQISLSMNRSFRSSQQSAPSDERPVFGDPLVTGAIYDPSTFGIPRAPIGYLDYGAPWAFSLGVTLNKRVNPGGDDRTTATLDVSQFNTRLTPNWSVSGSTGIDLTNLEITQTRLSLRRDLHCWEMAINWQPIGITRAFSVSLYVKSGLLRDFLRLDVPNSTRRPSFAPSF